MTAEQEQKQSPTTRVEGYLREANTGIVHAGKDQGYR